MLRVYRAVCERTESVVCARAGYSGGGIPAHLLPDARIACDGRISGAPADALACAVRLRLSGKTLADVREFAALVRNCEHTRHAGTALLRHARHGGKRQQVRDLGTE
jgi:hypothetical protein